MRRAMYLFYILGILSVDGLMFSSASLAGGIVMKVPDFEDGAWQCDKGREMIWGPTRFCALRSDPKIKGMEIRLPWDGTPIYRLWGRQDKTYHALWILKDRQWTKPVRGDDIEWIPRITNKRLAGFILIIFRVGSEKPFAHESFLDPAEAGGDAPLPPASLPATLFERS